MDALNLNRDLTIGRVPFFGRNPGYRQFTSDLFPGSGGDKYSNACCGSNFSNLSGTLLAEWEECKTIESQIAAWELYDSQLEKWNAEKDAACQIPSKPTAPTLQTLIKTPVDACDEAANKKASDYNALVTNRYQTLLKAYNDARASCDAVMTEKPSPPSFTRPTGSGMDALTSGFTGFSNASGKSHKNINGCGCNYVNADGEVVATDTGGFKPDLSGLLAMAVVGALVWYVVNGKKIKF